MLTKKIAAGLTAFVITASAALLPLPESSKPGMVIFTNNYTITVKPDTELEEKLRV